MLSVYSDSCKHAFRALLFIAGAGADRRVSLREILVSGDYPEASLAKVLQLLAARGILVSAKGPGGGFRLARPAAEISLADIVGAVDGDARAQQCAIGRGPCTEVPWCPIHDYWSRAKAPLEHMLRGTTIADLAARAAARSRAERRARRGAGPAPAARKRPAGLAPAAAGRERRR